MMILERWPWDSLFLKLYIIMPALISLILIYLLYPACGNYSLAILLTIPAGLVAYYIFAPIHTQISTLLGCKSAQNGEAVAARLVINNEYSPGIAILRESVIILIPVTGRRRKLQLSDIKQIFRSRKIPRQTLISKAIFTLESENGNQYTFAIPQSTGQQWSNKLPNVTPATI